MVFPARSALPASNSGPGGDHVSLAVASWTSCAASACGSPLEVVPLVAAVVAPLAPEVAAVVAALVAEGVAPVVVPGLLSSPPHAASTRANTAIIAAAITGRRRCLITFPSLAPGVGAAAVRIGTRGVRVWPRMNARLQSAMGMSRRLRAARAPFVREPRTGTPVIAPFSPGETG